MWGWMGGVQQNIGRTTLKLTCGRGCELFHVNGVMDIVVLEYVSFPCLEVTLQPTYGRRERLGVDSRVERLVR